MKTGDKQAVEKPDSGLTLIELMAAMVILVFGAIAALSILVEAHRSNTMARAKTMAVNAAEEQMEIIFQLPPASDMDRDNQWFPVKNLPGPGPLGEDGIGQAGFVDITPGDVPGYPDRIDITVTWLGQGTLPAGRVTISAQRSQIDR
jgi:type II secretory pathway pseudopilin PulG